MLDPVTADDRQNQGDLPQEGGPMRRLLLGLAIASIAALSPGWVQADDQQIAQQIVQQLRQQKADGQLTGFEIDL